MGRCRITGIYIYFFLLDLVVFRFSWEFLINITWFFAFFSGGCLYNMVNTFVEAFENNIA